MESNEDNTHQEIEIECSEEMEFEQSEETPRWFKNKRILIFILAVLVIVGICAIGSIVTTTIAITSSPKNSDDDPFTNSHYDTAGNAGVVIDMGSSGTRVSIFGWDKDHPVQPLPYNGPPFFYSARTIGITSYPTPEQAAESLDPLLSYAERAVLAVGVKPKDTTLLIYGTGGLRSLHEEESAEILLAIEDLVRTNYTFQLVDNWLGILTGQEEASLDWITIQQSEIISRFVGDEFPYVQMDGIYYDYENSGQSIGVLDMGGSSTEISFLPATSDDFSSHHGFQRVQFNGETNELFSVSYEGLGHNDAFDFHQDYIINQSYATGDTTNRYYDPCLPIGASFYAKHESPTGDLVILDGAGDPQSCNLIIDDLLHVPHDCSGDYCGPRGTYIPSVTNSPFIAFSAFADVATFFNCRGQCQLSEFQADAVEFCTAPWEEILESFHGYGLTQTKLAQFCFEGLYIYSFLTEGIGFDEQSTQIGFYQTVYKQVDISWALGMMTHYHETSKPIPGL